MKYVARVCKALALTDNKGALSLTNLMMFALIFKVATTQVLDATTVAALFLSLAGREWKRTLQSKADRADADKVVADTEKLTELTDQIKSIKTALAFKK